jgi:hypothetical protein
MYLCLRNKSGATRSRRHSGALLPKCKVSPVLFLHFRFAAGQAAKFFAAGTEIAIAIAHPEYDHIAIVPPAVKAELARDIG